MLRITPAAMTRFSIPDMTCDGCVAAITRAVRAGDPAATVEADLPRHELTIRSERPAADIAAAIDAAGFTVRPAA